MCAFLVDHQTLDLVEHRRVGLVGIEPVRAPGNDDADRRLLRLHGADLHRRGMRAEQHARAVLLRVEEERVVHLARRVSLGKIERGEIVVVGLDVRPLGDGEAEVGENRGDLVDHLADRMDAAGFERRGAERQRDIDNVLRHLPRQRDIAERYAAIGDRRVDAILHAVQRRAHDLPGFRRHSAERLQQFRDDALLAERRDAFGLERGFVGSIALTRARIACSRASMSLVGMPFICPSSSSAKSSASGGSGIRGPRCRPLPIRPSAASTSAPACWRR